MKTEDFVQLLLKRKINLVQYHPMWQFHNDLAVTATLFKFPCKFDEGRQTCNGKKGENKPMCCCSNCYHYLGHFGHYWPNDLTTLSYYAERFEPENDLGFWRPGKGCILDRGRRSITCLNYLCVGGFADLNSREAVSYHYALQDFTSCHHRMNIDNPLYLKEMRQILECAKEMAWILRLSKHKNTVTDPKTGQLKLKRFKNLKVKDEDVAVSMEVAFGDGSSSYTNYYKEDKPRLTEYLLKEAKCINICSSARKATSYITPQPKNVPG